jgi:hypothetical protein
MRISDGLEWANGMEESKSHKRTTRGQEEHEEEQERMRETRRLRESEMPPTQDEEGARNFYLLFFLKWNNEFDCNTLLLLYMIALGVWVYSSSLASPITHV